MHPLIERAADGELPPWSDPSPKRLAHMQRVAALLGDWAAGLGLDAAEQARWRAAGLLHDALREEPPGELRPRVPPHLRSLAPKLLHGPAAAARLRHEGVDDEAFLNAVAYHTVGHADLDMMGRSLYIADFIEPGRRYEPAALAVLRSRMPAARRSVLLDVMRARIGRLLRDARAIRPETAAFWNIVTSEPDDDGPLAD